MSPGLRAGNFTRFFAFRFVKVLDGILMWFGSCFGWAIASRAPTQPVDDDVWSSSVKALDQEAGFKLVAATMCE